LVVVSLAALAVGLAAGVGASKVDLHGHRGRTATQVQPQRQLQSGSQASSLPATGSVHSAASTPYLYLVGSAEQENEVQQNLDSLVTSGWPLDATVQQVAGDAEADATMQAIADLNTVRTTLRQSDIHVVDLHASGAGMPGHSAAVSSRPSFAVAPLGTNTTVYLVQNQAG
jgi:hypothetical protein